MGAGGGTVCLSRSEFDRLGKCYGGDGADSAALLAPLARPDRSLFFGLGVALIPWVPILGIAGLGCFIAAAVIRKFCR
jgi:hypothetical protein